MEDLGSMEVWMVFVAHLFTDLFSGLLTHTQIHVCKRGNGEMNEMKNSFHVVCLFVSYIGIICAVDILTLRFFWGGRNLLLFFFFGCFPSE